ILGRTGGRLMPRSNNPDQGRWEITGPKAIIDELNVLLDDYMRQHPSRRIRRAPAALELFRAGYTSIVGFQSEAPLDGSPPHGTTGGSNILDDMKNMRAFPNRESRGRMLASAACFRVQEASHGICPLCSSGAGAPAILS